MNRYHLGILYCVLAFLTLITITAKVYKIDAYKQTTDEIEANVRYAINCTTKNLKENYLNANYINGISDTFFNSFLLIDQKYATKQEIYPFITFIL